MYPKIAQRKSKKCEVKDKKIHCYNTGVQISGVIVKIERRRIRKGHRKFDIGQIYRLDQGRILV